MFIGKALIISLSGFIAYIILMNCYLKDEIYSPIFPVVVCVGIAYLIASIFLSVFSFSANAILHCYILDEDIGGKNHPESLNEFLGENEKLNEKKNKVKGNQSGADNKVVSEGKDETGKEHGPGIKG